MKTLKMYIFNESNQPKEGWFKSCFVCRTITAQTQYFNQKNKTKVLIKRYVYVCPYCKKMLLKDMVLREYYETKVNEYIDSII